MKIGMLMFGDLHFFGKNIIDDISKKPKNDFINKRIELLLQFLNTKCNSISDIILIINGDLTNKASLEEFDAAYLYLDKIKNYLLEMGVIPYFVFSKGNHDLQLINNEFNHDSYNNYYSFVSKFVDGHTINRCTYYDIYRIDTLSTAINFISIDPFTKCKTISDFTSKKFIIDSKAIKNNLPLSKKEINIFLSHIPFSWYDRSNPNNYSFLAEQKFAIFSHEHNETHFSFENNNIRIDLNCFSEETRKNECGIVFGELDTTTTHINLGSYNYTTDGFVLKLQKELFLTGFFGYDNSKYKLYKNCYNDFMNKDVSMLCNEDVDFLDLFAKPKFYITKDSDYEDGKTEYKKLEDLINSTDYLTFITGKKKAGKTSVLKYIFSIELKRGNCPIYIKVNQGNVVGGIEDKVKKFVKEMYVNNYYEIVYEKNAVLLIDDFDLLQNPKDIEMIKTTMPFLSRIYICINEEVSSLNLAEVSVNTTIYRIQPFGYEARYKLIYNWVNSKNELKLEDEKNAIVDELVKMMNNISYDILMSPELVLILLNAYSKNESERLINSTKIIYYKYLISQYLVKVSEKVSFFNKNLVNFFYREIAYFYFKKPDGELKEFNKYFLSKYDLDDEEYYTNLKYLKNNNFFSYQKSEKFILSFFKAYFISEYYKTNIDDPKIKGEFSLLINNVYKDNLYVNIILFFLYNNTHKEYVELCLKNMNDMFRDEHFFDFDKDIKIFNSYIKSIRNEVKKSGSIYNNNISRFENFDKRSKTIENTNNIELEKNDLAKNIISANSYIEICSEIIPLVGTKEDINKLIVRMLELGLRMISNFVSTSKSMLLEHKNDEEFNGVFYISLAIIEAMVDYIGYKISSANYKNICEILESYKLTSTECIKRKIELILLRKNGKNSERYIDSVVKYKDKLLEEKNYIAAIFLLINIDIELNYVGAYDGNNTSLLIEKTNKQILSSKTKDPIIEMNRANKRKDIRRKKYN